MLLKMNTNYYSYIMSDNIFISDLQIHSKYSFATSKNMDVFNIAKYANIKGLNIVGTGDITHPTWFAELKKNLTEYEHSELYVLKKSNIPVKFILSGEVSTIYRVNKKSKKIHHCLLIPNFDIALQVYDTLKFHGKLKSDGRPIIKISSPELVELLKSISKKIEIYPAHIWTPWFGLLGSKSGFDSIKDCYLDQLHNIFAIETGLSSDPYMNRRISSLDRFSILSNSDCHSPYTHRLGREANVMKLVNCNYDEIINAIRQTSSSKILFTLETNPEYGKYHWSGHKSCNVSVSPINYKENRICYECGKQFTEGVAQRIEELSDRNIEYASSHSPSFKYIIPLTEIIANVKNVGNPLSISVQQVYETLINNFDNEFNVIFNIPIKQIIDVAGAKLGNYITALRNNAYQVKPGYDGVYGKLIFNQC